MFGLVKDVSRQLEVAKPPKPSMLDLPDVTEAHRISKKINEQKVGEEFVKVMLPKVVALTKRAIMAGDSYVQIHEHNFLRDDTRILVARFLEKSGYEVENRSSTYHCSCQSHLRWSWRNRKEKRGDKYVWALQAEG